MGLSLDEIAALYAAKGHRMYSGEPVTQLQHALQSAQLAEHDGASDELIVAAFFHDVGHLINDQGETPTLRGVDDLHQYTAVPFLRPLFPARVLDSIALHVDAKRYLCATRPGYLEALSADSQRSLALQGGVFSAAEAARFIARPGAEDAVRLRQWDDRAKSAGAPTPPLVHFIARAACCRRD
jgi:phosphonate degradation associated HDIG domain protein